MDKDYVSEVVGTNSGLVLVYLDWHWPVPQGEGMGGTR